MAPRFCIGQRWVSETEPELGLGKVISCDNRYVEIVFSAYKSTRKYASSSAPLRRITFRAGEMIEDKEGKKHRIVDVNEMQNGFIQYQCEDSLVGEDQISDTISFSAPDKRLLAGIADTPSAFNLRFEMLQHQAAIRRSKIRGFVGGRVDLIEHQLYIAENASKRRIPRVLLSDETGLGKTIEACLIIHRLLITGRALRVLILVPHTLVHQWFVELLRKFNHNFRIFTPEFGADAERENPFTEEQQFICSIDLLLSKPVFSSAVVNAQWDLVVVDEAHHLRLTSPSFSLLKALSEKTEGLILLSATPEQYGRKDHFARLQLLDPQRYTTYENYLKEIKRLQLLSDYIDKWINVHGINLDTISPDDIQIVLPEKIAQLLPAMDESRMRIKSLTLAQMIDIYAVGRVQYRNTRKTIKGFPKRKVNLISLEAESRCKEQLKKEMAKDILGSSQHCTIENDDPRILAIVKLLKDSPDTKFLIICTSKEKTTDIQQVLKKHLAIDIAVFHEEMTLIQADRNAAWFAEKAGARVMISSDIGSEGRNLQFCSHLILFDLPFNPELLEQRIGRLDRIGQLNQINLYIPYIINSPQHILCRWYNQGVDSLANNVPAAAAVFEELQPQLKSLLLMTGDPVDEKKVDQIIELTQNRCRELTEELFSKRDRLLELASFQPKAAQELVDEIQYEDAHTRAQSVMDKLLLHYGIAVEDAGEKRWALITEYLTDHAFPLPRQERPVITYDRKTALFRDDIEFLTIDHPMVTGALDLFLSSEHGSSAFALCPDPNRKELVLECVYILECIASAQLNSDRFLPPLPIRVAVNHLGKEVTADYLVARTSGILKKGSIKPLLSNRDFSTVLIPSMLETSSKIAQKRMEPYIEDAIREMRKFYDAETSRFKRLSELGAEITEEEFLQIEEESAHLIRVFNNARLRLDSVCLIKRS
ncbi:MAG: RNA polymerase-associated protein RapA [Fibrobacter sp.]|jgi:ATP-dependent helicase HepA|nr:RNA polymerase-associated protein RapA [Fibrobacter sp.]